MQKEIHPFKDIFASKGLRSTREREIVLKELERRSDHFNAERLYLSLRQKGPSVSRSTIYRTLQILERFQLIERLDIKRNCFYYEPVYRKKDHGHLICEQCGKIMDFSCASLGNLKSEICRV